MSNLTKPISGAVAAGTAVLGFFQLDILVILLGWAWANLGQLFYMATLLVSSAPIIPVSQRQVGLIIGVLALLLLFKTLLRARRQLDEEIDNS